MSTCNWLDLETVGSQPIMSQILLGHCLWCFYYKKKVMPLKFWLRACLHHGPWSWTMEDKFFHGQLPWSNFFKKKFTKSLGTTLGVMTKRNDHAPKSECAKLFLICAQNWQFKEKFKFDHSLVLSCLHFSTLLPK